MDQVGHAGMLRGRVQVKDNGMHRDRNVMFTATAVMRESNCKTMRSLSQSLHPVGLRSAYSIYLGTCF